MGTPPSNCGNLYEGPITSFTINNGTKTFDAIANPGVTFNVNMYSSYTVSFTIYTPNNGSHNSGPGYTWYDTNYPGAYVGYCYPSGNATIGPNQNVTIDMTIAHSNNFPTYRELIQGVNFQATNTISYNVNWLAQPSQPQYLAATVTSPSQVDLSWTASSANGGSPITGYDIYRGTASHAETLLAKIGDVTSYNDTTVASGQTYYYAVTAVNSIGQSQPSNEVTATPTLSSTVPSAPTNLSATAVTTGQINLGWNTPVNNGSSQVTGYEVQRSTNGGTTWSILTLNTGSTVTTYSDYGLTPSTTYTYQVSAINSQGTGSASNTASATTDAVLPLNKVQSGLLASDSLTNETMTEQQLPSSTGYWTYGGDAPSENTPYALSRDPQGLHIGVQSPANGTWAGYFGQSPDTNATMFHAIITTPTSQIPYQWYQNGMTVETSGPYTNYVTCFDDVGQWGATWVLGSVTDTPATGWQYNVLWYDPNESQPTGDCTIITNGTNYLQMYLNNVLVYQNSNLNLQIQTPFNVYLGPSSSYPSQLLNSTYTDYYVTSGEYVKVENLPSNAATVMIQATGGFEWASSGISNGTAMLDVGKYDLPKQAAINVYDSHNSLIESTGVVNIYGGDTYSGN